MCLFLLYVSEVSPKDLMSLLLPTPEKKKHNDFSVNLKEGGQLKTKSGDGEQMSGMVPGLGSVSGYPRTTP